VTTSAYLRPAKWRNAARRRIFEAVVPRRVPVRSDCATEYLGSDYGGWAVPVALLDQNSVAYSIGAGGDVSFDTELIRRTGCVVHSFDPAPQAKIHAEQQTSPNFFFHNVAIWSYSGELEMFRAANPSHMALSAVDLQQTKNAVVVPCRTIESIRTEAGHEQIDLLKLTMDGAEYDFVPHLDLSSWHTRVLVVNFQHNRPLRHAWSLIADLRNRGFVPIARKPPAGYTFVEESSLEMLRNQAVRPS
jgi:FkbM family methyltransferase